MIWKALKLKYPSFEVTDEDVENRIKDMQARYAQLVVKAEDESAAIGDTVYHDFEGFIDGVPLPAAKGKTMLWNWAPIPLSPVMKISCGC